MTRATTPVHLSMPRGGNACGEAGASDADHLQTTCPDCNAIHDAHEAAVEAQA